MGTEGKSKVEGGSGDDTNDDSDADEEALEDWGLDLLNEDAEAKVEVEEAAAQRGKSGKKCRLGEMEVEEEADREYNDDNVEDEAMLCIRRKEVKAHRKHKKLLAAHNAIATAGQRPDPPPAKKQPRNLP